jgi:hypothetical protein
MIRPSRGYMHVLTTYAAANAEKFQRRKLGSAVHIPAAKIGERANICSGGNWVNMSSRVDSLDVDLKLPYMVV